MNRSNRSRKERLESASSQVSQVEQIFIKLSKLPIQNQHPDLLDKCHPIIQLWHDTFSVSDPSLWNRMRRAIPKELNESAFIIVEMMKLLGTASQDSTVITDQDANVEQQPYTIIDMCSGVGYLSMFLSHLLSPESCSRIVPIDYLFALSEKALAGCGPEKTEIDVSETLTDDQIIPIEQNQQQALTPSRQHEQEEQKQPSSHLSTTHLTSHIHPIPIRPRKANIKRTRELKQISQHVINKSPGPTIILGVHLCKALSVHTVRLFNGNDKVERMYLKPCCLPGKGSLGMRDPPFWKFDHMKGDDGAAEGSIGGFGIQTLYCGEVNSQVDSGNGDDKIIGLERSLKQLGREEKKKEGSSIENHGSGGGGAKGRALFDRWTNLLCQAVDTSSQQGVSAEIHHIAVQKRHFQNQYIVATKQ